MIPDHLRLQPGQEALTPEQEAEALRFAEARIAAQLSTDPVDEPETERLLQQAYAVVRLPPPQHIHWVDGPLQVLTTLASLGVRDRHRLDGDDIWHSVRHLTGQSVSSLGDDVWDSVAISVEVNVRNRVLVCVGDLVEASVWDLVGPSIQGHVRDLVEARARASTRASALAYAEAHWLALEHFFDAYLAPNDAHALAHFNERVSGYWLESEEAILVRRPRLLARNGEGRLHSETGKCLEYHDGWGFYAWHGVRVPERVILAPEQLTRQDWNEAENVGVRRVMQERMGTRFVAEVGGVVLDTGPHGTLYEVRLPDKDPEQVARYVQVQDATTLRRSFLRVPPTLQTAAEAVAWAFQVAGDDYRPEQET